jgi:hypothetical protein
VTDFKAPWELDDNLRAIFDADGTSVAFLPNRHDPARARLLLKAPRLMTELRSVISAYGDKTWGTAYTMDRALSSARALIAEIEGGAPDREEYPDHGPTDPHATSGPGT